MSDNTREREWTRTRPVRRRGLSDIGRTEEEVIFGEATSKDVITLLNTFKTVRPDDMSQSEKLRLLLLYAASHPNKAGGWCESERV